MNCSEKLSNVIRGNKKFAASKMEFLTTIVFLFYLSFLSLKIHDSQDSMGRGTRCVTRLYQFQPLQ